MKNFTKIALLALGVTACNQATAQTDVTYYTTKGNFVVRLTDALTPRTVDSFIARVSHRFYDGLIFHRVIDGFMIQGGDPLGTGYGGPGYTTPDEFVPSLKNVPGAIAMANSGPNTNGSQFFINLVTNSSLDNHYTVFGMVTSNFTVVQTIGHVATNTADRPIVDVVMDSVRITHASLNVTNTTTGATMSMYPNPCHGAFTIALPAIATKLEVLNMLGQTVYSTQATGTATVDMKAQPAGLYAVRATNADGISEGRIVVE